MELILDSSVRRAQVRQSNQDFPFPVSKADPVCWVKREKSGEKMVKDFLVLAVHEGIYYIFGNDKKSSLLVLIDIEFIATNL